MACCFARGFPRINIFVAGDYDYMADLNAVRPVEGEYAESHGKYIKLVPEGDIIATLSRQMDQTLTFLGTITEARAETRYAPGKWSIKEVLGHVIDAERIFSYRALRFARDDRTPLPRFEIADYVRNGNFGARQLHDIAEEFHLVRRAHVHFFRHLAREAWTRGGVANGKHATVRSLAYLIAGHEAHHLQIIRTKYLR